MNHGSLFSGIGGFDLAAQWMGWNNVFHCEWNDFGKKVLNYYWPEAISYDDITKTDFTIHRGRIDILTGGFPCQPYSQAGKRKGKDDDRHLWPEMLRAIQEIQPRYVVGENVRGITNWNGGLVFDEVQADLEAEGYEVLPFLLPACAVNAPHRRDRVWFVAHSYADGNLRGSSEVQSEGRAKRVQERQPVQLTGEPSGLRAPTPHTHSHQRPERGMHTPEREAAKRHAGTRNAPAYQRNAWQNFPTQPPICGGDDGLPSELDRITFSKWRNESIKAMGNAIVPQVA
jgi:DNA (cytosine-5)-methyltransferase 1